MNIRHLATMNLQQCNERPVIGVIDHSELVKIHHFTTVIACYSLDIAIMKVNC